MQSRGLYIQSQGLYIQSQGLYRVSKKKLMLFQIQISCEFITVYSHGFVVMSCF